MTSSVGLLLLLQYYSGAPPPSSRLGSRPFPAVFYVDIWDAGSVLCRDIPTKTVPGLAGMGQPFLGAVDPYEGGIRTAGACSPDRMAASYILGLIVHFFHRCKYEGLPLFSARPAAIGATFCARPDPAAAMDQCFVLSIAI